MNVEDLKKQISARNVLDLSNKFLTTEAVETVIEVILANEETFNLVSGVNLSGNNMAKIPDNFLRLCEYLEDTDASDLDISGNPFNLTSTVTAGIVSAKGRNLNLLRDQRNLESQYSIESFIQTDAAVNPGNSGGALVSADGKLVGINTAIASQTGQYAGYAFAVPANLMKKVIGDLTKYGEVQRGLLGVSIQDVNSQLADKEGLSEVKGVFVAKVNPNSAAEEAGVKDKDVIVKVDGVAVNSSSELQEQVGKRSPGDKVALVLLRNNKEVMVDAVLKNKEGKTGLIKTEKVETNKALDAEFETVAREERLKLKITNGVRVKKVAEKSILKKAGVPQGFIITSIDKRPVATPSEVKQALENAGEGVLLGGINPDGSKGFYGIGLK